MPTALAPAVLASCPTSEPTGPLAAAHPQWGDLSYFVSFVVAYAVAKGSSRTFAQTPT